MKTLFATLGTMLMLAQTAAAQDIADTSMIEEPDATLRLESWLRVEADAERSANTLQWIGTSALLVLGPLELTLAGVISTSDADPHVPGWLGPSLLTSGMLATIGAFTRLGIQLFLGSPSRDRLERFRRARDSGQWSEFMRGQFESEWRSLVRTERAVRNIAAVTATGLCVVGGTLMLIASQTNEASFRLHDEFLGTGIALAATGCLNAPFMLIGSQREQNLEYYDQGLRHETPDDTSVAIVPSVGPNQLGVGIAGTF